ncbi:MAG: type IX secretion system outer membrane channel protein PorV [Ferruginibacter sp.]
MKKAMIKLTALVLFLGSAISIVNAQSNCATCINVVSTAVPFLRISPDARSGGMGDVGIATAPDANAAFWNLAKTPFNTNKGGLSVTYTPWLQDLGLKDIYLASLSGYYKIDEAEAISGSLRYFNLGSIQFTSASGEPLGEGRPREFGVDVGYSRKLSEKLGLGVSLRYINSSLASGDPNNSGVIYKPGTAVAGDLSVFHTGIREDGSGLNYGVTLSNLGSKISYTNDATQKDFIPANLGIGVAYTKVFDETSKMTFGLDINKLLVPTLDTGANALVDYHNKGVVGSWFSSFGDAPGGFSEELKEVQASLGAEFWYQNQFALRAGYFYENALKGNRKYFTVGAGLKYNTFGINFSFLIPSGNGITRIPLSNTLRFSLIFDFAGEGESK